MCTPTFRLCDNLRGKGVVLNFGNLYFDIVSDLDIRVSSLCYINSTNYYVRIYKQIMQNKPNFPCFSAKNEDYTKKQTQTDPIQTQSVFCFTSELFNLPKWHKN